MQMKTMEINNKKYEIPTKTSQLTNDSGFLTSVPSEYVTEDDLREYAKGTDIPMKTSELVNDSGFLTSIPSEYVTETELNAKGYLTQHQDLSGYAKKTDVPTKTSQLTNDSGFLTSIPSEYVTETELNAKGYLTQHQDLSGYAKKSEVDELKESIENQILVLTESDLNELTQEELAEKYEKGTRFLMVNNSENLVYTAIAPSGAIYNGCGYLNGYRLNSSGSITETDSAVVTGYIPYTYGKTIEITGGLNTAEQGGQYVATYDDTFTLIGVNYLSSLIGNSGGSSVCDKNNVYTHTIKTSSFSATSNTNMFKSAKYIRVSLNPCIGRDLNVRYVD